ncbi:MAG TPA: MFS transporter [Anaerolineae bacterium]|nr:MFS transporter [Anaerolineae bacterium]
MPSLTSQRNLWTLRLYYFMLIGGGGFLFPFINLFYTQRGLSGTEIGLLSTVASLAALIAAPWWGRRSDATAHPRRLLQFGLFATSLCMLALSQQTIFAWMALIVTLDAVLSVNVAPLSDVVALAVIKGRAGFGSVRLWGSLGWAVTALLGGWLIEQTGLFAMFAGYAISGFVSIMLLAILKLPRWGHHQSDRTEAAPAAQSWRATFAALFRDRTLFGLALALSILWFSLNGLRQFEPVYLDQLGASKTIIGLASTIGAAVELPAMWWVDRLGRRHSAGSLLRASFLMYVAVALSVVIAPTVPVILFSHVIDGVAYSFFAVASVLFIAEVAPNRQVTTMMAIFMVTLPAIVRMISGPVSGWVFDARGAYALYIIGAIGSAVGWLIMKGLVKDRRDE